VAIKIFPALKSGYKKPESAFSLATAFRPWIKKTFKQALAANLCHP
jgi:hypothetical protein